MQVYGLQTDIPLVISHEVIGQNKAQIKLFENGTNHAWKLYFSNGKDMMLSHYIKMNIIYRN